MKKRFLLLIILFAQCKSEPQTETKSGEIKYDDKKKVRYDTDFKEADISSSLDRSVQKAFFYKTRSYTAKPLVVSLHTWSGSYAQRDSLAALCKKEDINYIHPDFRGPDTTGKACCSRFVIADIDDAIDYAIANARVDTARIFIIGVSGGGYATLAMFMKSKHRIRKFSAWAAISDLDAWFHECRIRKSRYADDILACTESPNGLLDEAEAKARSPLFWDLPAGKRSGATLSVYAGIYDGIQGSVPITHSINFYNKILSSLAVKDSGAYVSASETLKLLEYRRPLGDFGKISGREICLRKKYRGIQLTIFTGNHEMLPVYALNELMDKNQHESQTQ